MRAPAACEVLSVPATAHAVTLRLDNGAELLLHIGLDTVDILNQIVVSHHFRFGDGKEATLFRSRHRYVWPAELDLMAQIAGFTLESRHADWIGSPFTAESRSHISVYRLEP